MIGFSGRQISSLLPSGSRKSTRNNTAVTVTEFRAFEIFGADFAQESCESINFFAALAQKAIRVPLGLVPPILREAEKMLPVCHPGSVENSPSSA